MKHIVTMALMLNFGVAGVYAHDRAVKMTFAGTGGSSSINLQYKDSSTGEDNWAGSGTLGQFAFRDVFAEQSLSPDFSRTCPDPNQVPFARSVGAGVFRFQDGSLLKVTLTQGTDCIDFTAMQALCTVTFQIAGGTGRFKDASGTLTFTENVAPVLADALGYPAFFAATGEFTGTISGVARGAEEQDEQQ